MAATSFRLVGYKVGSAILEVEEAVPDTDENALKIATEGPAIQNMKSLLDAIEAGALDPAVVDDLEEALRAIGEDGRFTIKAPARRKRGVVNAATITRLRRANAVEPDPRYMVVFGRLHLIATEGTPRVEIRATDGYNWHCVYPRELEPQVVQLVTRQVQAKGWGIRERANRGRLRLESVEGLPQYERTPLFSFVPVPTVDLEREQGIVGPQGLAALSIADLPDDEGIDRYLASILED